MIKHTTLDTNILMHHGDYLCKYTTIAFPFGIHSREIQRDWYNKWDLSLHGFLVVAQIGEE